MNALAFAVSMNGAADDACQLARRLRMMLLDRVRDPARIALFAVVEDDVGELALAAYARCILRQ